MQELKVRVAEATEPAEINAMISENQEDWKAIRLTQKRVTMADANDRDMTGQ
jgi:hypothetical protein